MAFTPQPGAGWPVDVLTADHLVSGEVEPPAQKWGWTYFALTQPRLTTSFDIRVTATASTSGLPAPAWTGAVASFAFHTGLIAIIPRGPAAVAVWEEWNAQFPSSPAVVLVGPYAVTGTVITADGWPGTGLINHAIAVREAAITRVDGKGDGTAIPAERAIISTQLIHAIAAAG